MNAARRKQIEKIISELQDIQERMQEIENEEQEYLDNIPENLQGSEKYEKSENAIFQMQDASLEIESCIDNLENSKE